MGTRVSKFRVSILVLLPCCLISTGCRSASLISGDFHSEDCPILAQASGQPQRSSRTSNPRAAESPAGPVIASDEAAAADQVTLTGFQLEAPEPAAAVPPAGNSVSSPKPSAPETPETTAIATEERSALLLEEVVASIRQSYPLLLAAMEEQAIALGNQTAAEGEFDLKLKAETLNGPSGFYQTYRHAAGLEQPIYSGGSVFGGYRLGRGDFQPWYLERQTNDGGEFKAGFLMPLARNREIDARRAGLALAGFDVEKASPFIQLQLIDFLRAGSLAYWDWVAAGRQVVIARNLLQIATARVAGLKRRIEEGDIPEIELTDNERLIVKRRAKLIDVERKLRQSAIKLSLFLRDLNGEPLIPDDSLLPPAFPDLAAYAEADAEQHIGRALQQRPELQLLELQQRQIEVQMSQAANDLQPSIDLTVAGSQDVGRPTSKKRDKSEFEVEAGVLVQVPVQRRKARGKLAALEGKLSQVRSKSQFTEEKVTAEVQSAVAALMAAAGQAEAAARSLDLTRQMEQAERTRFDEGGSNLLLVNLREQATADAASILVEAQQAYFQAFANLQAATADSMQATGNE